MTGPRQSMRPRPRSGLEQADSQGAMRPMPRSMGRGNQFRQEQLAQAQGQGGSQGSLAPLSSVRPMPNPRRGQEEAEVFVDEFAVEAAIQAVLGVVPSHMMANAPDHVAAIVQRAAWDHVLNHQQVAYILATAEHESGFGTPRFSWSEPLVEENNRYNQGSDGRWRSRNHLTGRRVTGDDPQDLDEAYWDDSYGGRLGNERGTSDAADYKGRGYVQLTGRVNYEEQTQKLRDEGFTYFLDGVTWGRPESPIDLVANPDHVNRSEELAAKVLTRGSMEGDFTGRDLPRYVDDDTTDYRNARRVINGDVQENGDRIAARARAYEAALAGTWDRVFWREGDPLR